MLTVKNRSGANVNSPVDLDSTVGASNFVGELLSQAEEEITQLKMDYGRMEKEAKGWRCRYEDERKKFEQAVAFNRRKTIMPVSLPDIEV